MFKKGDRVLIEALFEEGGSFGRCPQVQVRGQFLFVKDSEIRPWTERPTPPVTVLWTMHGTVGKYHVQSDGTVVSEGGYLTSEMQRTVLAAFVRHLGTL